MKRTKTIENDHTFILTPELKIVDNQEVEEMTFGIFLLSIKTTDENAAQMKELLQTAVEATSKMINRK